MFARLSYKPVLATFASFVLAATLAVPSVAIADELSDAQASLAAASKQLDEVTAEYQSLVEQSEKLDGQIDKAVQKAEKAQVRMIQGQEALGKTVLASYKSSDSANPVTIFLSSDDLDSFLKKMSYFNAIQEDQAQAIAKQRELQQKYSDALNDLDAKKDEQDKLVAQASAKQREAEQLVADASATVSTLEAQKAAEEQARLEAMKKKAEELKAAEEAKKKAEEKAAEEAEVSDDWDTLADDEEQEAEKAPKKEEADTDDTPSGGSSASDSSSKNKKDDTGSTTGGSSSASSSSSSSSSSGSSETQAPLTGTWRSGVASAYGGATDKSTPNPGTTATGAICNDYSMGVAVPMSLKNYRSYLGRRVEISYGGRTVIATVNDCGYMGGGSRVLDLQPGVFKALGFSSCKGWGLRTVSYRFL